ncbi:MAG TPA: hypothetical protein VLL52_18910, partial [Anaerolineae bacterium]|nr:hypothetical protein [Anaerolineae bacterium]
DARHELLWQDILYITIKYQTIFCITADGIYKAPFPHRIDTDAFITAINQFAPAPQQLLKNKLVEPIINNLEQIRATTPTPFTFYIKARYRLGIIVSLTILFSLFLLAVYSVQQTFTGNLTTYNSVAILCTATCFFPILLFHIIYLGRTLWNNISHVTIDDTTITTHTFGSQKTINWSQITDVAYNGYLDITINSHQQTLILYNSRYWRQPNPQYQQYIYAQLWHHGILPPDELLLQDVPHRPWLPVYTAPNPTIHYTTLDPDSPKT